MKSFIYDIPTKVYFGKGEENNVGKYIKEYNPQKVLLHFGGKSAEAGGLLDRVRKSLNNADIKYVELGGVKPNPNLKLVRKGIALCLEENVDFVLAVGGGSVMDSAKDIANGAANPEDDVWDYSLRKKQPRKTLNKACILTLSAAGSEMSDSIVITNEDNDDKRGYSNQLNRMNFAIENPELTYTVSPYQTACGIVDITMHTIERYFMPGHNDYITDGISESIIKNTFKTGKYCLSNPRDYEARANMMWASSLSHNGLTNCGKQCALTVHQLEHEVSGLYKDVAHGAGLAALWCSWARYVYQSNINRWLQYAAKVWDIDIDYERPEDTILKAIKTQEDYYRSIGMPTNLAELGVEESSLERLTLACTRNRSRILPGDKPLDYDDILAIYKMAMHA